MPEGPFVKKGFADIVTAMLNAAASPPAGRPLLTDASAGSVMRTLLEAVARELAVCYEQLEIVYNHGYIDTATGAALDNVVALLGLTRKPPGYLVGSVEFSRLLPAEAEIAIPAGTLIAGVGEPLFETTQDAVLSPGERLVGVTAQSVEPAGDRTSVPAGKLSLMPRPITAIEQVGNPDAMLLRQAPESDDELRARARQMVRGAHTGTLTALEQAVRSCGIAEVKVLEDLAANPGEVAVIIGDRNLPPNVLTQVYARVGDVRPAGIRVTIDQATAIAVRVTAALQLARELSPAEQDDVRARARQALQDYFGSLKVGESVRAAKVYGVLSADNRVAAAIVPPQSNLMEPFVSGQPVGFRNLMTNGDLVVGPSERVVLEGDDWANLTTESPGVRIDALLILAQPDAAAGGTAAINAVRKAAFDALSLLIARKNQELATGRPSPLAFAELEQAVRADTVQRAAFTIVHEQDGRATVLKEEQQRDPLTARERVRIGTIDVRFAEAGHG